VSQRLLDMLCRLTSKTDQSEVLSASVGSDLC
jgi:hypothetical protein